MRGVRTTTLPAVVTAAAGLALLPTLSAAAAVDIPVQSTHGVAVTNLVYVQTDDQDAVSFKYALANNASSGVVSVVQDEAASIADQIVTGPGSYCHTFTFLPGSYELAIALSPRDDTTMLAGPYAPFAFTATAPAPSPSPSPQPTQTVSSSPSPSPTQPVTPAPTPSQSVTPTPLATMPVTGETSTSVATVRGTVTVSSPGFAPNESYEIWLHSTPVKIRSGVAPNGTVRQAVSIPAGSHRFEIRGAQSGSV